MHCVWCDTPHSIGDTTRRFDQYTPDELWEKVTGLWEDCHSVSLTGGEPLMQKDIIKAILPKFRQAHMRTYLETNGIFYEELAELIRDVDIIAMDIKLPSSTKCRPYWKEHEQFLKIARKKEVFIKAVISSDTDEDDVLRSMDLVADIDPEILFILQPNYFDRQNGVVQKCIDFKQCNCARLKNIRIIPQVHKLLKVR
jgi:7-carboxy-7-deazaguanine synthase